MSYVNHPIGHLVHADPAAARIQLGRAFKRAKAHRARAAKLLGCQVDTFVRWCAVANLNLDALEQLAAREGWHHGHRGGKRRRSEPSAA